MLQSHDKSNTWLSQQPVITKCDNHEINNCILTQKRKKLKLKILIDIDLIYIVKNHREQLTRTVCTLNMFSQYPLWISHNTTARVLLKHDFCSLFTRSRRLLVDIPLLQSSMTLTFNNILIDYILYIDRYEVGVLIKVTIDKPCEMFDINFNAVS